MENVFQSKLKFRPLDLLSKQSSSDEYILDDVVDVLVFFGKIGVVSMRMDSVFKKIYLR